ncbi:MAG: hypothetical protein JKY95_15885 [Planctomycetaceae bacterium]|nr:hypothetical protein [Planctomycetaceae bacterium]
MAQLNKKAGRRLKYLMIIIFVSLFLGYYFLCTSGLLLHQIIKENYGRRLIEVVVVFQSSRNVDVAIEMSFKEGYWDAYHSTYAMIKCLENCSPPDEERIVNRLKSLEMTRITKTIMA